MTASEPQYDTILVGGGSAGCALARRLSEDPSHRVLVLEAGRPDSLWDLFIHMPAALSIPIGNPAYDWCYRSDPEPHMSGRRVVHARGRVLGGSSSINGMIFVRGNPLDFEKWAADPGMEAWDFAHCLPYFKRSEARVGGEDAFRGRDGPLRLEPGPCTNPLFEAFFAAAQEAGLQRVDDLNGARQEGVGPFDRNISRGRRLSAARAYLHPVLKERANLEVRPDALVSRIIFEGTRAVGVTYLEGQRTRHVARAGRVVLCGGAINSPQLLQLSGVGPAELLRSHGIDVVADRPGVGANLQDHLEVYIQHACSQPVSMQPALKWWRKPDLGLRWLFGKGPAATNHFEAGGFFRSNDAVAYPNVQMHFLPLAIRYDGTSPAARHGFQIHAGPMNSDARGTLAIRSTDPREHPSMVFNYLSTEQDRREWLEVIRSVRELLAQPAMAPFSAGEISPGPEVTSDEDILDWVARDAETALHPSCTCKMGTDPMAVADPATMAVHGTDGLAVVDASVMPYVTNANLYAPVMMIAEKAADLLTGATPLPPEEADWYRHEATV